jgi:hypothetical protein
MLFEQDPKKIQILVRNRYEMSQFWTWGVLFQDQTPEMIKVLATGKPKTVVQSGDFVSVLTPVTDSLGDRVALVGGRQPPQVESLGTREVIDRAAPTHVIHEAVHPPESLVA